MAFTTFIEWLFPSCCMLCGARCAESQSICRHCGDDLPWILDSCYRCALPLAAPSAGGYCGQCLNTPPCFEKSIAGFSFSYPVDHLIRGYKYHRHLAAGRLLSELLHQRILASYNDDTLPQIITAVPLHWRRLLQRGFNQATLTALHLGSQLRIPVKNLCRRHRYTPRQQGAKGQQRRRNLHCAFSATQDIPGQHIAVVDDVITTGSTAREVTRALKNAGAKRVDIWALARTPSPSR